MFGRSLQESGSGGIGKFTHSHGTWCGWQFGKLILKESKERRETLQETGEIVTLLQENG